MNKLAQQINELFQSGVDEQSIQKLTQVLQQTGIDPTKITEIENDLRAQAPANQTTVAPQSTPGVTEKGVKPIQDVLKPGIKTSKIKVCAAGLDTTSLPPKVSDFLSDLENEIFDQIDNLGVPLSKLPASGNRIWDDGLEQLKEHFETADIDRIEQELHDKERYEIVMNDILPDFMDYYLEYDESMREDKADRSRELERFSKLKVASPYTDNPEQAAFEDEAVQDIADELIFLDGMDPTSAISEAHRIIYGK